MKISFVAVLFSILSLSYAKSQSVLGPKPVDGNVLSMRYDKLVGTKFPLDKLQDLHGKFTDVSKYRGRPILINFWFTTCSPCIEEMPNLNGLKSKYKNKINCISITRDDKKEVVNFLKKRKFDFDHFVSANELLTKLNINGFPMSFLVDKSGVIKFAGFVPGNDIDGFLSPKIRQLL